MKQIEVNGMLLEFDEKLLLKQEIRVGDNVQVTEPARLYPVNLVRWGTKQQ